MSKNKTLLKFLCFCCIVEVFVASSLPRFLSYCNCWVFSYIIITIVSLKLYHLLFLASCWGFCYIAELSIVVFCCKMLALLWWSWQWSLCQGFLFSFITFFFLVLRQFSSYITKFFATSFYSIHLVFVIVVILVVVD